MRRALVDEADIDVHQGVLLGQLWGRNAARGRWRGGEGIGRHTATIPSQVLLSLLWKMQEVTLNRMEGWASSYKCIAENCKIGSSDRRSIPGTLALGAIFFQIIERLHVVRPTPFVLEWLPRCVGSIKLLL